MIVFDLRCAGGHVFEAWFASSGAWQEQQDAGRIACPMCGVTDVEKAVMAPAVAAKGNSRPPLSPQALKQALAALAGHQARMLESSQWVGPAFAERARAMHAGDEDRATIHGQASMAEAKALIDDGIPVTPLPLPVTPPDQVN